MESEKIPRLSFDEYTKIFLKDYHPTAYLSKVTDLRVYDCGKEQCMPTKETSRAVKPYYLFHLVESGRGTFIQDGRSYEVRQGQMFTVFPERIIEYYPNRNQPWLYKWFSVKGALADEFVRSAGITPEQPIVTLKKDSKVKDHVDALVEEFYRSNRLNLACLAYLYLIFHELLEQKDGEGARPPSEDPVILEAINYIGYNFNNPITVKDIAKSLNLNPSYFISKFHAAMGISPKQYLHKMRMEIARERVLFANEPVAKTARSVGYTDALNFSKAFRKWYGASPREFLKQHLKTDWSRATGTEEKG